MSRLTSELDQEWANPFRGSDDITWTDTSADGLFITEYHYDCNTDTLHVRKWMTKESEVLDANNEELNDSNGRRWGDGRIAATIPLHHLYDPNGPFLEAMREGDTDHIKKKLNDADYRKFRTFGGTL